MFALEEDDEAINVLHELANSMNSFSEAHQYLLDFLRPDPFTNVDLNDDATVMTVFSSYSDILQQALSSLMKDVGDAASASQRGIPASVWNRLIESSTEIANIGSIGTAVTPFRLRSTASKVRLALESMSGLSPKPLINSSLRKNLLDKAKEMERVVCLFDLRRIVDRAQSINKRLYTTIRSRRNIQDLNVSHDTLDVLQVVNEIVKESRTKAVSIGINIRVKDYSQSDLLAQVPLNGLRKSLNNLLDNAIKYTGQLPHGSDYDNTWISIFLRKNMNQVDVAFESWGTPITHEEYRGGFIFKAGYRGWFVRKTGVPGTGTGLTDVRNFALQYGGDVIYVTSPVSKSASLLGSTKTTVILKLPLHIPTSSTSK